MRMGSGTQAVSILLLVSSFWIRALSIQPTPVLSSSELNPEESEEIQQESDLEYTRRLFKRIPTSPRFRELLYNHPDPFGQDLTYDAIVQTVVDWALQDEASLRLFMDAVREYQDKRRHDVTQGIFRRRRGTAQRRDVEDEGYEGCVKDYSAYIEPVVDDLIYPILLILREECYEELPAIICDSILNPEPPDDIPQWAAPCKSLDLRNRYM